MRNRMQSDDLSISRARRRLTLGCPTFCWQYDWSREVVWVRSGPLRPESFRVAVVGRLIANTRSSSSYRCTHHTLRVYMHARYGQVDSVQNGSTHLPDMEDIENKREVTTENQMVEEVARPVSTKGPWQKFVSKVWDK